jgi:AcrR family transcriptional regulator
MFPASALPAQTREAAAWPLLDTDPETVQEPRMPAPDSNDRRSRRTRSAVRQAMLELITERGWDAVAVQDICDRADIGRSTFYTHYPGKDELLLGSLEDLRRFLREHGRQRRLAGDDAAFSFALGLAEHAFEQRRLFRALVGRRSGYLVQQRFREMVIRLVGDELPPGDLAGLPRSAVQRWLAGAFVELLGWWIEQRSLLPPEELAGMFDRLARPVLGMRAAEGKPTA